MVFVLPGKLYHYPSNDLAHVSCQDFKADQPLYRQMNNCVSSLTRSAEVEWKLLNSSQIM